MILPASRLHDGICDCCDGSDEDPKHAPEGTSESSTNPCTDNCDEILREERLRKIQIKNDFLIGSRKRESDLFQFIKLRDKKVVEASNMEQKIEAINSEIEDIGGTQIKRLKEDYVSSRVAIMKDSVVEGPMATALLSGLTSEELEALLVHLCQVAGEIAKSDERDSGDDTCLALRVAALDMGLTWSHPEDYDGGSTEATFNDINSSEIVQIIFSNAAEDSNGLPPLRWKSSSSKKKGRTKGRRRLDEINDDYMMMDDIYPMDDDGYPRSIDEDDYERDYEESLDEEEIAVNEIEIGKEKEKDLMDEIRTSLFSANRATFLKESQGILNEIATALDTPPTEEEDDDKNEAEEGESSESDDPQAGDSEASAEATIDPSAYTMLRNNLHKKRDIVEVGFHWGASAKILLGASSSGRQILERLVIGTIFYGQISALQVWQIFQSILPEYKESNKDVGTTCASPWAGSCPPKQVLREPLEGTDTTTSGRVEYPPSFLLEVATAFCDEEVAKFGKEGDLVCQENGSDRTIGDVTKSLASLPSGEDHSFFGYTVPRGRNPETDPFRTMFEPISTLPIDTEGLRLLEERRDAKETEVGNLQKDLNDLWKEVGGKDGDALGRDGELHSIADKCFDIVAGKYTYEMCLFGKASQKEGNSKTNLGKFKDIVYEEDEEDHSTTRVLKWTDGAKCWNGPKRSATMYLKCGAEHKVVSANEPDTCRYVFEMESYLACDEDYKRKMGL